MSDHPPLVIKDITSTLPTDDRLLLGTGLNIKNKYLVALINDILTIKPDDSVPSGGIIMQNKLYTAEGGVAIKLKAGSAIVKGQVVRVTADRTVLPMSLDNQQVGHIGVAYTNASINTDVWIVFSGEADVLPLQALTPTVGYYLLTASSTTVGDEGRVGQAEPRNVSIVPIIRLVGCWLSNGTGNGILTRAILKFN